MSRIKVPNAWFAKDPESGIRRDEFGGTVLYEDTGLTLAQEFPEFYFQAPVWVAWILTVTEFFHFKAQEFAARWDKKSI